MEDIPAACSRRRCSSAPSMHLVSVHTSNVGAVNQQKKWMEKGAQGNDVLGSQLLVNGADCLSKFTQRLQLRRAAAKSNKLKGSSIELDPLDRHRSALIGGSDWIRRVYSSAVNGNCGMLRKDPPSIHSFIKDPRYQPGPLCIRITERLRVNRVGYGKSGRNLTVPFSLCSICPCSTSVPSRLHNLFPANYLFITFSDSAPGSSAETLLLPSSSAAFIQRATEKKQEGFRVEEDYTNSDENEGFQVPLQSLLLLTPCLLTLPAHPACSHPACSPCLLTPCLLTLPAHTLPVYPACSHPACSPCLLTPCLLTACLLTPCLLTLPAHTLPAHTVPAHTLPAHPACSHPACSPCLLTPCLLTLPAHTLPAHTLPAHTLPAHAACSHPACSPCLLTPCLLTLPAHTLPAHTLPAHPACSHPACSHIACSHPACSHPACSRCLLTPCLLTLPAHTLPAHPACSHPACSPCLLTLPAHTLLAHTLPAHPAWSHPACTPCLLPVNALMMN
ncbi:hypothetical protein NQZ68_002452 [Dissostichus eleginoides]|nr:hypothetical protein NQZ68_002452 [Dissostichus eleginoides]